MHLTKSGLYKPLLTCYILILFFTSAYSQHAKKLDSLFETLAKKGILNGCVLVAEDGKPVYQKAFGYADFATKRLNDNNTMFELASVSKQFTAMAIMQLHQQHKLNYDDDISKYFPKLKVYKGVTISHLLHHTSGISELFGWNEKDIDVNRVNYTKDIADALAKNLPYLNFKPGDNFAYSNTNYVLLALIVEQTSGEPFAQYLDKHIFKPLGMDRTQVYGQRSTPKKITNYALGHIFDPNKNRFVLNDSIASNKYQYYFDGVAGAYGVSSTTGDMLKWDQAFYTEKLVTKQEQSAAYAVSLLNNGTAATLGPFVYGFGWYYGKPTEYAGKAYMHAGGYPGYTTFIKRYPDKNRTIVILTNTYNIVDIANLATAAENIIFDQPFAIPEGIPQKTSIALSDAKLKKFDGTYAMKAAPQVKFNVTSLAGQLYIQAVGHGKFELYPQSELDFFYTVVDAKIRFVLNDDGTVQKMIMSQAGHDSDVIKEVK